MWERWDTSDVSIEENRGGGGWPSPQALWGKQSRRWGEWWKAEEEGSLWGKHNGSCDLWRWTSDPHKPAGGHRFRLLPAARLLQQHTSLHTVLRYDLKNISQPVWTHWLNQPACKQLLPLLLRQSKKHLKGRPQMNAGDMQIEDLICFFLPAEQCRMEIGTACSHWLSDLENHITCQKWVLLIITDRPPEISFGHVTIEKHRCK